MMQKRVLAKNKLIRIAELLFVDGILNWSHLNTEHVVLNSKEKGLIDRALRNIFNDTDGKRYHPAHLERLNRVTA